MHGCEIDNIFAFSYIGSKAVAIEGGLCEFCKEGIKGNISYQLRGDFTVLTVYIRKFTI